MGQTLEPAALYIHIPFCLSKCPYCDFYSLPYKEELVSKYLESIKREIFLQASVWRNYRFVTLYVGGGTPSLLPPSFYYEILEYLGKYVKLDLKEISIESNPGHLPISYLRGYREIGFNRLSIGMQTFSSQGLKILRRIHSVTENQEAWERARQVGFSNINLDFIFGWPGQTLKDLYKDLQWISQLFPEHISFYELTLEKETPWGKLFPKNKIQLPSEEVITEMYLSIENFLQSLGYKHYEISNYALEGYQCKHNIFYWKNWSFWGLGPSAASYLKGKRYKNMPNLQAYLKALDRGSLPPQEEEILSEEARFRETVVLGLRLLEGVGRKELYQRFKIDIKEYYGSKLEKLVKRGLLKWKGDKLLLSSRGWLLANQVGSFLI